MITGKRHGSHFTVFIINFTTDVVLLSLLLTLNQFHTLFWYFRCWFWTIKCRVSYVSIKSDFTLKNWLSNDIISAVYIIQYFWKTVDHVFLDFQKTSKDTAHKSTTVCNLTLACEDFVISAETIHKKLVKKLVLNKRFRTLQDSPSSLLIHTLI